MTSLQWSPHLCHSRGYIGVIQGLYRGYIGVILGLYWGYIGIILGLLLHSCSSGSLSDFPALIRSLGNAAFQSPRFIACIFWQP